MLQDATRYFCFAEFDPSRGVVRKHYRFGRKAESEPIDGQFEQMWQGTMALYTYDGSLYFYVYGRLFELDDDTRVAVSGPREECMLWRRKRSLQVLRRGQLVFEANYRPRVPGMIRGDPTPMVAAEHFDFGLWVSNISNSPERKAVALRDSGGQRKQN